MIKKIAPFLLLVSMCCSLAACNGGTGEASNNNRAESVPPIVSEAPAVSDEPVRYEYSEEHHLYKIVYSSWEQFENSLITVELTMDNWNDYLGDVECSIERAYEETNNFGEVVSSKTETVEYYYFGLKTNYLGDFSGVGIKFSGYTSRDGTVHNEEITKDFNDGYMTALGGIHCEDYECLGVIGSIQILDIGLDWTEILAHPQETVLIYVGDEPVDSAWGVFILY